MLVTREKYRQNRHLALLVAAAVVVIALGLGWLRPWLFATVLLSPREGHAGGPLVHSDPAHLAGEQLEEPGGLSVILVARDEAGRQR